MNPISRSDGALCIEAVSLEVLAQQFGTPCYIYSRGAIENAWHDFVPVQPRAGAPATYDVVGPVCESGDFLGLGRSLTVQSGDLLAILSAGAYGMSMSSNYNTRPRAAEVIVDGAVAHLVRAREPVESLFPLERILP